MKQKGLRFLIILGFFSFSQTFAQEQVKPQPSPAVSAPNFKTDIFGKWRGPCSDGKEEEVRLPDSSLKMRLSIQILSMGEKNRLIYRYTFFDDFLCKFPSLEMKAVGKATLIEDQKNPSKGKILGKFENFYLHSFSQAGSNHLNFAFGEPICKQRWFPGETLKANGCSLDGFTGNMFFFGVELKDLIQLKYLNSILKKTNDLYLP